MFSRELGSGIALRLLGERDAGEVFALVDRNREHLRRWMPWVGEGYSVADAAGWLRRGLEQLARNDGFQAGITLEGALVGVIGFHAIDWPNRKTSLGYWLSADAQGRGVMTTACRAMVDHALVELGLNRAEIRCGTGNARSRRIPERLGFTLEGVARETEWLYDHFVDLAVYSMLARDWPRLDASFPSPGTPGER
jgi:ribosomal-protein-serine acetyltransferase